MATRSIGIGVQNPNPITVSNGTGNYWNGTEPYDLTVSGQVLSDLFDFSSASTGISLHVNSPFKGATGSGGYSDGADHHGWPGAVFYSFGEGQRYDLPATPGTLSLRGFSPGQSVTLGLIGHNNTSANRYFSINGGTPVFYSATATPPSAPLQVDASADANGHVVIAVINDPSATSVSGVLSALTATYDEVASQTITNIDQLISGQTANVTLSASMNVTDVIVSDGVTTITGIPVTGSGTSWSFTAPTITDLATGLKLGNVSVTFTDGTDTTAGYSIAYQLSGYTAANITSVSDFALGVYFDPPTQVGDQFAYQADKGKVETNGEWNDGGIEPPFVGTQTLWHYSSVDQTWRDFELTTTGDGSEPEPEPPGDSIGMTRRNITRRAFTRRAQTSRGMTS